MLPTSKAVHTAGRRGRVGEPILPLSPRIRLRHARFHHPLNSLKYRDAPIEPALKASLPAHPPGKDGWEVGH